MARDVPSPIDLRRMEDALEWEATAMAKRPWRADFFAAFVAEIRSHLSPNATLLELGSGPGFLAEAITAAMPDVRYTLLVCDHYVGPEGMSNAVLYMTEQEQRQALEKGGFRDVAPILTKGGLVLHSARPSPDAAPLFELRGEIEFCPLRDSDIPMLHEWIHRPHVMEWWGGEAGCTTLGETRSKYLPRLAEDSRVRPYIAFLAGEPIGFIQSYVALGCGGGWWQDETDPGVRGIDQFLADGARLGRGLGTRMVSAFVRRLFEDRQVTRVQTDPAPTNGRAIRCYEKAGFRPLREVTTPAGRALLMIIERPEAGPG